MKKIAIIIFFISFSFCFSQQRPIKNFQIIDSLIKSQATFFAEQIKGKKLNTIKLNFSENPAQWLIKQHFYTAFKEKQIDINNNTDFSNAILNINIKTVSLDYSEYKLDYDSLIRIANVDIDANLSTNGNIEIINSPKYSFKDIISREDINYIKSDNEFANASVPEKKKTFFEEIAIPFVVVTTAILTVVILFTVRSG